MITDAPAVVRTPRTRRSVSALVAAVALLALALAAQPYLQRTLLVQDDHQRGIRYADAFRQDMGADKVPECVLATRALYGDSDFGYGSTQPPRNARAFFEGCSGVPYGD